ncbi:Pre-rRNA-processing protein TSR2-domain-containing protein [Hysterangium stoloniferum]|nr:Pre-rRNA-processing protein TSR2-domain-containing protein [Hysterangium stoloniferum]
MASSSSDPTPSSALVSFARGIIATLITWPALRVAVEGGWGGPESVEKRTWLASAIVDAFEEASSKQEQLPDAIYVEEMLLQVLADEFEVVLEDDSARPVATDIVRLWQEVIVEGRVDGVTKAEALVEKMRGKKIIIDEKAASDDEFQWEDEDEEGDSEDDVDDVPQLLGSSTSKTKEEPEIDDDGFTMVKGGGRSHR